MENRQSLIARYLLILAFLAIGASIVKYIVLGGLPVITLAPATPLSSAISQGLTSLTTGNTLPVEGKDFVIKDVHYFDNQTFAVVSVGALKLSTDPATLVLQKLNGSYRVILGPGTTFSASSVQDLPSDVVQYLNSRGVT